MAFESDIGLLFRIKADGSQAKAETDDTAKKVKKATKDIADGGKIDFDRLGKAAGDQFAYILQSGEFSFRQLKNSLISLGGPIGVATGGLALLTAGYVAAGAAIFSIAKQASDFGSEINDASEKTGIGAETLSALKLAADQSGSSLEAISGGLTKFSKTIADAALGNDKAAASLKRLGIDGKSAVNDLDGAFAQAVKRISELPPGVQQSKAAMDAFGKSGASLIPTINTLDGDVEGFIKKARELGVVLSQEDVKAADAFGDTLDVLKAQAAGVGFQFAKEFMPAITNAMKDISRFFVENKDTIASWGKVVKNEIETTVDAVNKLIAAYKFLREFSPSIGTAIVDEVVRDANTPKFQVLEEGRQRNASLGVNRDPAIISRAGEDDYLENEKAKEDAAKEAEKRRKEQLKAEGDLNKALKDATTQAFEDLQDIRRKQYEAQEISHEQFIKDFLENENKFVQSQKALVNAAFEAKRAEETNKTADKALNIEEANALAKIDAESQKRIDAANEKVADSEKKITETIKKESDEQLKIFENKANRRLAITKSVTETLLRLEQALFNQALAIADGDSARRSSNEIARLKIKNIQDEIDSLLILKKEQATGSDEQLDTINKIALLDEELARQRLDNLDEIIERGNELFEVENRITERKQAQLDLEKERLQLQIEAENRRNEPESIKNVVAPTGGVGVSETLGDIFGQSDAQIDKTTGKFIGLKGVFADIAGSVKASAKGMVDALGSAIVGFLLYGDSIGKALKQAAAAELAHIASVSAIKAIYQLAEGFAALFFNPAAAAAHFKSAALYGVVAIGAGIGARALAGDSFKQQTSTNSGGASAGAGGAANGGGQKSNQTDNPGGYFTTNPGGANGGGVREEDRQRTFNQIGAGRRDTIDFRIPAGMIERTLIESINNRTEVHGAIVRLVEA